jgi:hypothetical protein
MKKRVDVKASDGQEPVLTEEELRAVLEERTKRYFNMTLDEFIRALDEGTLPDTPTVTDIALFIHARPTRTREDA